MYQDIFGQYSGNLQAVQFRGSVEMRGARRAAHGTWPRDYSPANMKLRAGAN